MPQIPVFFAQHKSTREAWGCLILRKFKKCVKSCLRSLLYSETEDKENKISGIQTEQGNRQNNGI